MRRMVLAILLVGCSMSSPISAVPSPSARTATPSPTSSSTAGASAPGQTANIVPGGCGSTPLLTGGIPGWLVEAGAHNNPAGVPYALAVPVHAAGFLFGYPLRAGRPENPSNKILWVVGLPRNGSSLEITGHPVQAPTPSIHLTFPANASPGEIYPSAVDVPDAGCWSLELAWDGHRTSVDLMYR